PTLEYPATSGPYDILMTSYPGLPVPGEAANGAFYITNRDTGQPYDQPVSVRALRSFTWSDAEVIYGPVEHQPFDNQHKATIEFAEEGEHVVELTLQVEGRTETIPFVVVVGDPSSPAYLVIAAVAALAVFLVVVRAIKLKRDRRAKRDREPSTVGSASHA
ncbi:MAG: hypothetical protein N2C14_05180, partial [Planctomycetales bacterium]